MIDSIYKIRIATVKDIDVLKVFEQEIIKYERPYAPNLRKDPIFYYDIKNLIERVDAQVLVAELNDEIIGCGYALIKNSPCYKKPEKFVYLGFMYVSPINRGKGVNGLIVSELIKWAKIKNIKEIQLDVYSKNKSALKAYQKLGFNPDLLKMRLGDFL